MNPKTIVLCILVFGACVLSACGVLQAQTNDVQRFADALVREDYHTAAGYWNADADTTPEKAEENVAFIRSLFVMQYGTIKGATVQDVNVEQKKAHIIWQLERADLETLWDIAETDHGLRLSFPSQTPVEGRLNNAGVFATATPSPEPSLSAAELEQTADVLARETSVAIQVARQEATDTAEAAQQATQQAATETAIAMQTVMVAAQATATELAKPPEAFLTARQAFEQAKVREAAQKWQADAMLVRVSFKPDANILSDIGSNSPKETALDGTSRVWAYMFASKQLQKVTTYIVQDGNIIKDTGNDAATYKSMFAGKGEPFDIALEQYLDSDQVATIGRENKAEADSVSGFQLYLVINPNKNVLQNPPAQWGVAVRGFFGYSTMYLDGMTGNIVSSDFGPAGNPGAIPTPMAAASDSSAAKVSVPASAAPAEAAATATPAEGANSNPVAEAAATAAPAAAANAAVAAIAPVGVTASDLTAPSRDSKGNPITYDPSNVIDGRADTAWRVAGNGAGQSITLVFDQPVRLSEVALIPGYAKIDAADGTDRFMQNRRVKRAALEFTNRQSVEGSFIDKPELQAVHFDPVVTSFVRITIEDSTNPGTTDGRDFTAISEVHASGQTCDVAACGTAGDTIHALLAGPHYDGVWTIVEGVDGDFARLHTVPTTPGLDSAWSFVKRKGNGWEVLTAGTAFPPEDLQKLGVPKSLWLQ